MSLLKLNYIIHQPIDKVYSILSQMPKFCAAHPVIYRIENISKDDYRFFEKIKLIFFSLSFSYVVSIQNQIHNQELMMYSKVQPGVNLLLHFTLIEENGNTIVTETVNIHSFYPIRKVFEHILIRAHQQLFANIENAR